MKEITVKLARSAAILFVAVACACTSQTVNPGVGAISVVWSPPKVDWPDDLPSTVPKEMIGALRVAGMPVVLEETRLEDVRKRLGGTIGSGGDGGEAVAWLCLYGSDGDGPWISWLTSGEIEGLTHINGLQWRQLSPNEIPDRHCRELPQESGGLVLPIPLHLGMKESEARRILGRPTFARGSILIYSHEHHLVIHKEPYTSDDTVGITLRNGIVREIVVVKVTSS